MPGGRLVVIEGHPPDDFDRSDLWAIDLASGEARHLCGAPGRYDHSPAVDPRGTTVAYASARDDWDELCLVALDGSGERRLTAAAPTSASRPGGPTGAPWPRCAPGRAAPTW